LLVLQGTLPSCRNISHMLRNCCRSVAKHAVSVSFLFWQFSFESGLIELVGSVDLRHSGRDWRQSNGVKADGR
jgi:hypothetical protein